MSQAIELSQEKRRTLLALALIAVTFYLRMHWLGDMEFKSDEANLVKEISGLTGKEWQPLAGISHYSGIAHSSGFAYFMNWITPNPEKPLQLVRSVAFVNSLFLGLSIWLMRHSMKWLLTFALCATSATLVFGSRKIWPPDLMHAWVILAMGLFGAVLEDRLGDRWPAWIVTGEAAFLLVMSGHMYLPAGLGAAVMTVVVLLWLAFLQKPRKKRLVQAWLVGSALGWLTFVPYFYLILTHAPGTRGQSLAAMVQASSKTLLDGIGKFLGTGPSTLPFLRLYVRNAWGQLGPIRGDGLFQFAALSLIAGGIVMLLLYWATIYRTIRQWRDARRDPVVLSTLAILIVFPAALFFSRLGSHLHYWLSVMPLFYYWIAWASSENPGSKPSRAMKIGAWLAVFAVGAGTLGLQGVIHRNGGFPGEYWLTYQNPLNSFSAGIQN